MKRNIRNPIITRQSPLAQGGKAVMDLKQRQWTAHLKGDHATSLACALQLTKLQPRVWQIWMNAGVSAARMNRAEEALGYAKRALQLGGNGSFQLQDLLAHIHGLQGDDDLVRTHGRRALELRAAEFNSAAISPPSIKMPPAPGPDTRARNVIAFSLFGALPKYCETAVLNAQAQPQAYPDWTCWFYVDDSVPEHVVRRLGEHGAHCIRVEADVRDRWPGPMWRFRAYDAPGVDRVLFRDADSLISAREAEAVREWVSDGTSFHLMRDFYSHTELILAGMWGAVTGAMPPMGERVEQFLSQRLSELHFADQYFLRAHVWPYVCASVTQHDSQFGFMGGRPFADGVVDAISTVGYASMSRLNIPAPPGASHVTWEICEPQADQRLRPLFRYDSPAENGVAVVRIHRQYGERVLNGALKIRVISDRAHQGDDTAA